MSNTNTRELAPGEAVGLFLDNKRTSGIAHSSLQTYRSELGVFCDWCDSQGIKSIHEIDGLDMQRYKTYLSGDYARTTVGNRLRTAVELLDWCVSVNAADAETVRRIEFERPQDTRSGKVESDEAEAILERLERFRYASREHVTFLLLWRLGCRIGTLRALDRNDVQADGPAIRIRHRPETGTPLKNGNDAERIVGISQHVHDVLTDYIGVERASTTDKHGREPLLTTTQGRVAKSTVRLTLYGVTRPCWYGSDCPVDRDPDECEAAQTKADARECPENNSPHDVRRGRLTRYRRDGVDPFVISDRCDVSEDVLEEHYNEMTERERMEQRREYLN